MSIRQPVFGQPASKDSFLADRKELAKVLGVSVRRVAQFEADGVITPRTRGRGGRGSSFALEEAVPKVIEYLSSAAGGKRLGPKARRDLVAAKLAELQLAKAKGQLVPLQQVLREGQIYTGAWAAIVSSLPRRLAQAAGLTRDQEARAKDACKELRAEIASWKVPADLERAITEDDTEAPT